MLPGKMILTTESTLKAIKKEERNKAIYEFANWCYMNGIDFSYMMKATDTENFCERVIKRFNEEQLKGGSDNGK